VKPLASAIYQKHHSAIDVIALISCRTFQKANVARQQVCR